MNLHNMNKPSGKGLRRIAKLLDKGFLVAVLLGGAVLSGCTSPQPNHPIVSQPTVDWIPLPELKDITYAAADGMIKQIRGKYHPRQTILPASFVSDQDLNQSSAMGRLLAQQMASRFIQAKYTVVEIKVRKDIRLRKEGGKGQFLLSRELEKVAEMQQATSVLVGSYIATRNQLFVNTQLILLKGSVVLASQDFIIPLTFELRKLLAPGT